MLELGLGETAVEWDASAGLELGLDASDELELDASAGLELGLSGRHGRNLVAGLGSEESLAGGCGSEQVQVVGRRMNRAEGWMVTCALSVQLPAMLISR